MVSRFLCRLAQNGSAAAAERIHVKRHTRWVHLVGFDREEAAEMREQKRVVTKVESVVNKQECRVESSSRSEEGFHSSECRQSAVSAVSIFLMDYV